MDRQARASQSFWTVVVGVPAIFSVLRLGVEAGGELQATLLLVANVGPVNLVAALVTTATRLASSGLVAIFAIGAMLAVSADRAERSGTPGRRPMFARWTEATPIWFVLASFGVALVTWQILYLPLLLPALAAAFQLSLVRPGERLTWTVLLSRITLVAGLLAAYGWLMASALPAAWAQREYFPMLLLAAPPLLALSVGGPVPATLVRPLAVLVQPAVLGLLVWAGLSVIATPVLPLTVTTVADPTTGGTEDVRGHVITVDDVNMVILRDRGGVRYVPIDQVKAQVLCPGEDELPRHRLRVYDFHVDDSLLEGLGRRVRPVNRVDSACRTAAVP